MTSEHDRWREDGRLANEIANVNRPLGRHALRISDSMLGDTGEELSPEDEHDLGIRVRNVGDRIVRRAERRRLAVDSTSSPQVVDNDVDPAQLGELPLSSRIVQAAPAIRRSGT